LWLYYFSTKKIGKGILQLQFKMLANLWVGAMRIKTRPDDSFKGHLDEIEKDRL